MSERYTAVAIVLHWLIAIGILALIGVGLAMTHLTLAPMLQFQLYQLHKSIGITVLLGVLLRILWRVFHPPPALPDMPRLEKAAAEGAHTLLYVLMVVLPLTGWALVSVSPFNLPTVLYGLVPWPHLPVLPQLKDKAPVEAVVKFIHGKLGWLLLALVVLHAGAALRHHLVLRDGVLRRMLTVGFALMKSALLLVLSLLAASPALASDWTVDPGREPARLLRYSDRHALPGQLRHMAGRDQLRPDRSGGRHAGDDIDLGRTGDTQRDTALPQPGMVRRGDASAGQLHGRPLRCKRRRRL